MLLCFSVSLFSQQEYDSLKQLLPLSLHDTTRLAVLSSLAEIAPENEWQRYNLEMKGLAARKILSHPAQRHLTQLYLSRLSEAYFNEGMDHVGKMRLDQAQHYFRKGIAIDELLHNNEGLAYAQVELAKILTVQGNYEQAIEALYQALKAYEQLSDLKGLANTYINIGRIYLRQNQHAKAFGFFNKGYKSYEQVGYTKGMIDALDKMSAVYYEQSKLPEALHYMRRIRDVVNSLKPNERAPHLDMFYKVAGKIHQLEGNTDSALWFYQKGLALTLEEGLIYDLSGRHRFLASIYKDKNEYAKAIYHAKEALKVAGATHSIDEEHKDARALYELYVLTGNHEKALRMHEFYVLMADSIRRHEDENKVVRQQFKYEFEKKQLLNSVNTEKRISALKLEAERKSARKNLWIVLMAACLSLLGGATVFMVKYLRQKNVIASQKANLLRQKLLLSQMNPHFIFNSLNAIQSYVFRQDGMQASEYLSQLARLMRMILEFSRQDRISLATEMSFLKLYMDLQILRLEQRFTYELVTNEEEPELVLVPPMLAQPFIENAIEHGFSDGKANGHISVSIRRESNWLHYTIEDNGVGLEPMQPERKQEGKHQSLAMKITTERLETLFDGQHKATGISITNRKTAGENNSGVRISFTIPYQEAPISHDQSSNHR